MLQRDFRKEYYPLFTALTKNTFRKTNVSYNELRSVILIKNTIDKRFVMIVNVEKTTTPGIKEEFYNTVSVHFLRSFSLEEAPR